MQVDKQEIVNLLRERGEHEKADQAEKQLPDKVDHDEHRDLFDSIGIDGEDVMNTLKAKL